MSHGGSVGRRRPASFFPILLACMTLVGSSVAMDEMDYVRTARAGGTEHQPPKLRVRVSPKLELVMLVSARADHERRLQATLDDNPIGRFWSQKTSAFGFEEAPRHLRALMRKGLHGDRLLLYAMHLSEPPRLEQVVPWSEELLTIARSIQADDPEAELEQFRQDLKEFAEKVRFMEHFREKKAEYEHLEQVVQEKAEAFRPLAANQDFWGIPLSGDFYLIPSPLVTSDLLTHLSVGDETYQFFAFGPARPRFLENEPAVHHMLFHELSHPLVDPIVQAGSQQLAPSRALWIAMSRMATASRSVQSWPDAVGEHLLRAYNIRLLRQEEPVLAELAVTSEELGGFPYTRRFTEILDEYAAHRDDWPSLGEFFPTLATRLEHLAGQVGTLLPSTQIPSFEIQNAGFEQTASGWRLPGWDFVPAGRLGVSQARPSYTRVDRDSSVVHGGRFSLRLRIDPSTTRIVALEQGPLAVRAGGTARISCWVKTDNVKREGLQQKVCGLYLLFLNDRDEIISRAETDSAVGTLDWTSLSGEFVAPDGTARARVGILLGMSGTAWFDDLEMKLID
ncbi:MAG: DUF4932 domain-containing protein [Acidobacteriota bacterium]